MDSLPVKPPQDAVTIRRLRLGIGAVGIALPIVLTFGNALLTGERTLLDSISAYYYTDMRDVFVGSMCAIGVFLICYRYERLDDLLSTIAGVLAIAVALFPVAPTVPPGTLSSTDITIGRVHQVCAAALFVLLAIFCIFLFPRARSARARAMPEKRGPRNAIYYACGGIILGAITLAVASNALPQPTRDTLKPLFWCEVVAVFAFGAAWLIKGEALYRDSHLGIPTGSGLVRGGPRTGDSISPSGAPAGP
ncbi:DUF998 domain-containing protein [Micromonospora sp. NPDC049679]|uniref:DUF998 domain-containing protein n=1 Tax=Micromonospora sp. NPDC049679 TaxID=3155920 RepID=UPI0033DC0A18